MAAYNKFFDYSEQVNRGVHNWGAHVIKAMLSNVAPVATNTVKGNLTDIAAGFGYTAGGMTLDSVTLARSSGTTKVTIADEVLTAAGGTIGPFRYVIIYNDTPASPVDPLVCWYDIGSSINLLSGESFTIDFDAVNGLWQFT